MKGILNMGNRAAIYARFSSNNQREESIDAQVRAISEYAAKNDYVIVEKYIDEAFSATSDKRPAFLKMINDSSEDIFDVVIIHKLDRFSRNRYDSAIYKRELQRNNIKLLSVLENLDDSPESIMLESTLEAVAEYFSKNLAREVRKGLKENALKGSHTGGRPPLGYMLDENKKLVIEPDEALIVKMIFKKYTLENMGYGAIATYLNGLGLKTRAGKPFNKNSFYDLLKNEKYIGTYTFDVSSSKDINGKRNSHKKKPPEDIIRIENNHEPIISKELFNLTQQKFIKNKHKKNRTSCQTTNVIETYLLSGLVSCSCGAKMIGNRNYSGRSKKMLTTYSCNNRLRKINDCKQKPINAVALEKVVVRDLTERLFGRNQVKCLISQYRKYTKEIFKNREEIDLINKLKKELKKKTNNLEKLVDLVLESDSKTLISKMETLEIEISNIKNEITRNENLLNSFKINVTDEELMEAIDILKIKMLSFEYGQELQRTIRHYIESIVVDDKEVYIRYAKSTL